MAKLSDISGLFSGSVRPNLIRDGKPGLAPKFFRGSVAASLRTTFGCLKKTGHDR